MDSHLSPAETAKRFGISIKALRLYEQRGLLKPLRAANGSTGVAWRVYGPDQVARLHQILAPKRLGLSRALTLIRKARTQLASGDVLSIDDLATLTQETVMAQQSTAEELKEILTPFTQEHLTRQERASLQELTSGQPDDVVKKPMKQLLEEAKALMTAGDAASAAAIDLARRFRATTEHLKSSEPSLLTALRRRSAAAHPPGLRIGASTRARCRAR